MKAIIFSGTTEGRQLSLALAQAGAQVTVSVASDYGVEEQGTTEGVTVVEGLKDAEGMRELIRGADVVIDATHPYAVIVTENIRQAAAAENVERLRLIRERSEAEELAGYGRTEDSFFVRVVDSAAEAADAAAEIMCAPQLSKDGRGTSEPHREDAGSSNIGEGNVLLTTGSKDLPIYAAVLDPQRLYPRVLPLLSSIEACEASKIPHRNIIAIQGPFSEALNLAVLRDYHIDVMITKESGRTGGFLEKIRACQTAGVPAIVIRRPQEEGLSFDQVLAACRKRIRK